jgi:hypothetical protein
MQKTESWKGFFFFGRRHEGKSRQPTTNLGDLSEKHRKLEGGPETTNQFESCS